MGQSVPTIQTGAESTRSVPTVKRTRVTAPMIGDIRRAWTVTQFQYAAEPLDSIDQRVAAQFHVSVSTVRKIRNDRSYNEAWIQAHLVATGPRTLADLDALIAGIGKGAPE